MTASSTSRVLSLVCATVDLQVGHASGGLSFVKGGLLRVLASGPSATTRLRLTRRLHAVRAASCLWTSLNTLQSTRDRCMRTKARIRRWAFGLRQPRPTWFVMHLGRAFADVPGEYSRALNALLTNSVQCGARSNRATTLVGARSHQKASRSVTDQPAAGSPRKNKMLTS